MFVSFDGTDGVGKSTQIEMFTQWLSSLRCEYVFCRDPGSTALGDALRDILLQKHDMAIDRRSEMFLYMKKTMGIQYQALQSLELHKHYSDNRLSFFI